MKLTRVLLVGAGRSHLEVLRHLARRRDAALEITLASPEAQPLHAPMLPSVIAGDLAPADARLDLSGFARGAGMRFVPDQVASVDLYTRIATLESGEFVPFDVLSLDTGALPERTLAAAGHAIAIRPVRDFLAAWERLRQDVGKGEINTLTVVGGGAIAIELVLAMHRRLAREHPDNLPRFAVVSDRTELLPGHPQEARRRIGRLLVAHQIVIHLASAVAAVESRGIVTVDRRRIASDRVVLATRASGPEWVAGSGLACDNAGFPRINEHLQSISHPFVFAAPQYATVDTEREAQSLPFSRRAARTMAANLARYASDRTLARYRARGHPFVVIPVDEKRAIASTPPLVAEGEWVWRLKQRIDRRFVTRFRLSVAQPAATIDEERLS